MIRALIFIVAVLAGLIALAVASITVAIKIVIALIWIALAAGAWAMLKGSAKSL